MRKIRIFAHISLDGVISPGGRHENSDYAHGGWTAPYRTPAGAAAVAQAQGKSFDLLLGRRTYDLWAGFWPKAGNSPIADSLNAAPKYVATHRPESLEWGPVGDLGADILKGIRGIKSNDGPDLIVWGSTTLTSALFQQGLVDEVLLFVYCSGGAGLTSSAADYARFLQMLASGGQWNGTHILKPETVREMISNQIGELKCMSPTDQFGYGFGIVAGADKDQVAAVGSYYWGGFYGTGFWVDPEKKLVGVFMTQLRSDDQTLYQDFMKLAFSATK